MFQPLYLVAGEWARWKNIISGCKPALLFCAGVPTLEGGTMWGDGTLNYDIRVGSNYLYSTGGDAGVVSGSFYGDDHGYVGGTVERSDLTAAFGGKR